MNEDTIIESIHARKIFSSYGDPTIEVDVVTVGGFGRASAPSEIGTGKYKAIAFPNGDVDMAIREVEEVIAPELIGLDANEQQIIDKILRELDGTNNFSKIGASVAIATSIAVAKAAANSHGVPLFQHLGGTMACILPIPLGSIVSGGRYTKDLLIDIHEILIIPKNPSSFSEALEVILSIRKKIPDILRKYDLGFAGGYSDGGAWITNLKIKDVLKIINEICVKANEEFDSDLEIGINFAAPNLWDSKLNKYIYQHEGFELTSEEQISFILSLIEDFNLFYIEDPLYEDDFEGFSKILKEFPNILVCGNNLYAANTERISKGVKFKSTNSLIINPNQIGTLTDTWNMISFAKNYNLKPIISNHLSETLDESISHISVAAGCPIIKIGTIGGEHMVKLCELLRIEEVLGERAKIFSFI